MLIKLLRKFYLKSLLLCCYSVFKDGMAEDTKYETDVEIGEDENIGK